MNFGSEFSSNVVVRMRIRMTEVSSRLAWRSLLDQAIAAKGFEISALIIVFPHAVEKAAF